MKNEPGAGAKSYFETYADNFNSYYKKAALPVVQSVKSSLWRDLFERERITAQLCEPVSGKSILDIGCGDGHYALKLFASGASTFWGLDFSQAMIAEANKLLDGPLRGKDCQFIQGNFLDYPLERDFDYTIAMGVMDYIADPKTFIQKALKVSKVKTILSFPQSTKIRGTIRHLKYNLRGCQIHLYTHAKLLELLNSIPEVNHYKIYPIPGYGMDFVVEIFPAKQSH